MEQIIISVSIIITIVTYKYKKGTKVDKSLGKVVRLLINIKVN